MFNHAHLEVMMNLVCCERNHDDKYEMNGEYWKKMNFDFLVECRILVLICIKPTQFAGISKAIYKFHPNLTKEIADEILNLSYAEDLAR